MSAPWTRRRFLGRSAALTGSLVMPRLGSASTQAEPVDVVVVGAGLSGLCAARRLQAAGLTVRVLEAQARVGGRTLNQPLVAGGVAAEGGAQWVGPTQDAVLQLMAELGLGRYDSYSGGSSATPGLRVSEALGVLDYVQAEMRLDRMAARVPLDAPWLAPEAAEWDRLTVRDWMDRALFTNTGRSFVDLILAGTLSAGPEAVSLLYFLFYVQAAGSLNHLTEEAQKWRVQGGAGAIGERLARSLGDVVLIESPVSRIDWSGPSVRVDAGGRSFHAQRVVVATMPSRDERIAFEPDLPEGRRALQRGWVGSPGTKFSVAYERPFWRDEGLSGEALDGDSIIGMTFDNSPDSGEPGVLVAFANDDARLPSSPAARRKAVVDALAGWFGPKALKPIGFAEKNWAADPWVGGCVSPLPPGVLTRGGPHLRAPIGPIHWAGTETADRWCGYMDGAVRAGERAAREVIAAIGSLGA